LIEGAAGEQITVIESELDVGKKDGNISSDRLNADFIILEFINRRNKKRWLRFVVEIMIN